MAKRRPIVMVSSSVYGQEELLERIYSLLTALGYEVWMSHKGTIPTNSDESSLDSCLKAVENCDIFLGLITTNYGTTNYGTTKDGTTKDETTKDETTKDGKISATHSEFKRAIELNKRRWFLIHDRVVFARQILRKLGHNNQATRHKLDLKILAPYISDLRVFDMYEDEFVLDYIKEKSNTIKMRHAKNTASQLRTNIEDGILRPALEGLIDTSVSGNFGYPQRANAV